MISCESAEIYKIEPNGHKYSVGDTCILTGLVSYPEYNGTLVTITACRQNGRNGRAYYVKGDINKEMNWVYEHRLCKQVTQGVDVRSMTSASLLKHIKIRAVCDRVVNRDIDYITDAEKELNRRLDAAQNVIASSKGFELRRQLKEAVDQNETAMLKIRELEKELMVSYDKIQRRNDVIDDLKQSLYNKRNVIEQYAEYEREMGEREAQLLDTIEVLKANNAMLNAHLVATTKVQDVNLYWKESSTAHKP